MRRDALLGERLRAAGDVIGVRDIADTEPIVEQLLRTCASDWIASSDHGDVAARKQNANDRWLDQWRRHAALEPRVRGSAVLLACECDRNGCLEEVAVTLDAFARPILAH